MKTRGVTHRDVQDAALVGQIVAEADLAEADVTCVVDSDDCCGHMLEEHCVAEAIGASGMAVWLWLVASNAISATLQQRARDVAAAETPAERRRLERLYAWVDSVAGHVAELGHAELHAAALLRDGVLPPDWEVVPDHVAARRDRERPWERPHWP